MKVRNDQLQTLWRDATEPRTAHVCDCLDDEVLERAARGTLKDTERSVVIDHLVGCSHCSQAVQARRELSSWAVDAQSILSKSQHSVLVPFSRRPVARYLALAAVLVLATGLGALWRSSARPTSVILRGKPQIGMAVTPADGSLLESAPERLSWTAESGEPLYTVAIFDQESTIVWRSTQITGADITLPPDIKDRLGRPGRYYWRVTGIRGVVENSGPLMTFDIVEAPSVP